MEQSSTDLQSFGNEDGEMRSQGNKFTHNILYFSCHNFILFYLGDPESTTSSHDSQFTSNIAEQQEKNNSVEDLSGILLYSHVFTFLLYLFLFVESLKIDTSSRDSLLSPSSLTLENAESELSPRRTSLPVSTKRLDFAQTLCTSRKCKQCYDISLSISN